ncbi:MAG: LTA synthase family protein [Lachnospiraceae bacterium]|nr:LTA synthase family protein [Lachnospiraceae bacterium]
MSWIILTFIAGIIVSVFVIKFCPSIPTKNSKLLSMLSYGCFLLYPLFAFFLLEFPWNDHLLHISPEYLLLNYLILLCIMVILSFLSPRFEFGIYFTFVFAAFVGIANLEVVTFRFYPIAPVDILSLRTAAAVVEGYHIFFNKQIGITLFFLFLFIIFVGLQKDTLKQLHKKLFTKRIYGSRILCSVMICIFLSQWIVKTDFYETYSMEDYQWDPIQTYKEYGFSTSFSAQLHEMIPNKPEGYKSATATDIVNKGAASFDETIDYTQADSSESPVILIVMNESFTDYDMVGDFSANEKYLSFFHSLETDPGTLEYGGCYTSTFGGGTYKSEFECLTGNSMANIPGTIPYMMFDFFHLDSLVSDYNDLGFSTVASHPMFPTNWRRQTVYEGMGFSKFLDIDDFHASEKNSDSRGYLNDLSDYKRLVEEIETTKDPLFLFNVTIQNHGGYNEDELGDIALDIGEEYNAYQDACIFAGDMKKSDEALSYLLEELRKISRPVYLCFYGDHQPSLNEEFLDKVFSGANVSNTAEYEQLRYITPYIIWTNQNHGVNSYTPVTLPSLGYNVITPTYLGIMARYYAGLPLSDFDKYMVLLRKELPILNTTGIYTTDTGFVSTYNLDTMNNEHLEELLNDYSYVEYQRIYD